jgi:SAM-dependent methyltransferase
LICKPTGFGGGLDGKEQFFFEREGCPVCGATNADTLLSIPYSDERLTNFFSGQISYASSLDPGIFSYASYTIKKCGKCGLLFQAEIPNEKLMGLLYEDWIDPAKSLEKKTGMGLADLATYANEVMIAVEVLQKSPHPLDVLDFGSGWGKWCQMAKAFNCNVYGFEISKVRVEYSVRNGINAISEQELRQHQFDFINCEQVLEHVANPLETLSTLANLLKPSGMLRVNVPNCTKLLKKGGNKGYLQDKALQLMGPLEHINGFTRSSLVVAADLAGLRYKPVSLGVQYRCLCGFPPGSGFFWKIWKPIHRRLVNAGTELTFTRH